MFEKLTRKIGDLIKTISGKSTITEKNIESIVDEIKLALLEADVNLRVVRRFVNGTIEEAKGEKVLRSVTPGQQFVKIIHDRLVTLLGENRDDLKLRSNDTTSSILLMGLQGSGKTTTAAKLGWMLKNQGRRVLLAACDLVRPAAVDQLVVLGKQAGIEVYHEDGAKDPVKVAKAAREKAKRELFDVLIVDTSGRLQIDEALMSELLHIRDILKPDESLLVADSMTGQTAVDIAKAFDEKIGISGAILSKFDSDTRGGAALSFKSVTGKTIKFIGTSEKLEGLEPFYPERIASRILGMGDIVTLVEKAQATIDEEEAEELRHKMVSETINLQDYLDQIRRLQKMGSLKKIAEMIPGLQGQIDEEKLDAKDMKKEEAIILSMTLKERANHLIIGPTRRSRIARGSGCSVAEVSRLIKKFEKARTMMKRAAKDKRGFGGSIPAGF